MNEYQQALTRIIELEDKNTELQEEANRLYGIGQEYDAKNAELLEALVAIVDLRPTPSLPADTWAIIFTAIRKGE